MPSSPTWGDIQAFLNCDGWRPVKHGSGKKQRHQFYEKLLPDGRLLQTHISHSAGKTISPGRFATILRHQLEVSKAEFWECIRANRPVNRPVEIEAAPIEHADWVVQVLVGELHMSASDLEGLSAEEAITLVHEHWASGG
jgi:hypothetical protein